MDSNNYLFFLAFGSLGFLTNSATLIYIVRNFNIRIHVYSLLFIDSLISTICALTSLIVDLLLVFDVLSKSLVYCITSHLAIFIPTYYGSILTFMVALIRYVLGLKSSKNIHLSNKKVSLLSLTSFFLVVVVSAVFIGVNVALDIPYTLYVEACRVNDRDPRNVSSTNLIALRTGVFFNVASVVVDCLMVRFIKKTTLKSSVAPTELSDIIFMVESNSISGLSINKTKKHKKEDGWYMLKVGMRVCSEIIFKSLIFLDIKQHFYL